MQAVVARGGKFLEAPLIGDKTLAVDGGLIILAAGDQSVYDDCASCFEAIGKKFYLGLLQSVVSLHFYTYE
jgi:3-hydroxyisobutyrate dehydrogenase-like beta-hydroxyacid dehydrogenase